MSDVEHVFMALAICVFYGKMSVQILCPFFSWIIFLLLSCKSSLYTLDINPSSYIRSANIFPILKIAFHFLDGLLCSAEVLFALLFPLVYFCFC